jgi:hypothetical protein
VFDFALINAGGKDDFLCGWGVFGGEKGGGKY